MITIGNHGHERFLLVDLFHFTHTVTDITSGEIIFIQLPIAALVLHTKASTSSTVITMQWS